jgi:transcriptional regulator with XRE-family HTH domain
MRHHMAAKGWEAKDLAAASDVSEMTVSRFLRGETQTVKTARKLALALGRTPRAYLMPAVSKTATV